jgi:carbonic anhydrase/acetyltransferase-like protein (isoleucine patch superfamily)
MHEGKIPLVHRNAFVDISACIIGDVISEDTSQLDCVTIETTES